MMPTSQASTPIEPLEHSWSDASRVDHRTSRPDAVYKLVLVGDSGVGKSSLLSRFVDDLFCTTHLSTIGVDFKIRTLQRDDGKIYKLHLWDTAGQERFRALTSAYYRSADGVILVYSVADAKSFEHISMWVNEVRRAAREECPMVLVANKCDLASQRQVGVMDASQMAHELGIPLVQTSAKDDAKAVEHAFLRMTELISSERARGISSKKVVMGSGNTVSLHGGRTSVSVPDWLSRSCSIL